jgi:hypothetical protein
VALIYFGPKNIEIPVGVPFKVTEKMYDLEKTQVLLLILILYKFMLKLWYLKAVILANFIQRRRRRQASSATLILRAVTQEKLYLNRQRRRITARIQTHRKTQRYLTRFVTEL